MGTKHASLAHRGEPEESVAAGSSGGRVAGWLALALVVVLVLVIASHLRAQPSAQPRPARLARSRERLVSDPGHVTSGSTRTRSEPSSGSGTVASPTRAVTPGPQATLTARPRADRDGRAGVEVIAEASPHRPSAPLARRKVVSPADRVEDDPSMATTGTDPGQRRLSSGRPARITRRSVTRRQVAAAMTRPTAQAAPHSRPKPGATTPQRATARAVPTSTVLSGIASASAALTGVARVTNAPDGIASTSVAAPTSSTAGAP